MRWPEGLPAPREVQQESSAGGVTIEAAWDLEQSTGESIRFDVGMNTHSVDLDKIDLARSSILRDDKGRQVKPAAWDSPLGGHHRSGSLVFSSNDGVPLVEADTRYVELVISGVAGPNERVLRWDLEVGS